MARKKSGGPSRARWVESPDEHANSPGPTLATRDHGVIRQWAKQRGAMPAMVPGTDSELTFDFPGYGGGALRHVGWDEWFRTFDARNLVFRLPVSSGPALGR